jgi:hypothetical protein|tara:strand:+ start:31268 stop:31852 length:585 start_codon:yes stop_codon:yes gene_type:complete
LISAFSTAYFPSVSYLKAFCEAENPVIDLGAQCTKQTERMRASILTANGIQKLSVPIIRPNGNKTATKDIQISFVESWERDHCRAIKAAYSSSPYFEDYSDTIFDLINSKEESLFKFNQLILNKIIEWLDLPIQQNFQLVYIDNPTQDYREFDFNIEESKYQQVEFGQKGFTPNLSILDAIFCLGPMARKLIIS